MRGGSLRGSRFDIRRARSCRIASQRWLAAQGVGPGAWRYVCLDRSSSSSRSSACSRLGSLRAARSGASGCEARRDAGGRDIGFVLATPGFEVAQGGGRRLGRRRCCPVSAGPRADHAMSLSCLSRTTRWHVMSSLPQPNDALARDVVPDDVAYVIYTSGSTGKPKERSSPTEESTATSARCWRGSRCRRARAWRWCRRSRPTSATRARSARCTRGRTLHMIGEARAFDGNALGDHMQAHEVGVLKIVPSHLRGLLAAERPSASCRSTRSCSAARRRRGSSWSPCVVSAAAGSESLRADGDDRRRPHLRARRIARSGEPDASARRALANTRVELLGPELQRVPGGATADLYIAGDGLARGYLARPDLTADRFIPDPFCEAERASTGPAIACDACRAALEFLGRVDDQIKLEAIASSSARYRCSRTQVSPTRIVVVREGQAGQPRSGRVRRRPRRQPRQRRAWASVRRAAPEYMVPGDVVWLDRFPVTPNGKIDRARLPAPAAPANGASPSEPRTPLESSLLAIWKEVLEDDRAGVEDNFFQLGGDSLLAFRSSRWRGRPRSSSRRLDLFDHLDREGARRSPRRALRRGRCRSSGTRAARRADRASYAQERMRFEWRFEPKSSAYNTSLAVVIEGTLDVSALEGALSDSVQRHEILRTRYVEDGAGVHQVIDAGVAVKLAVVDVSPRLATGGQGTPCFRWRRRRRRDACRGGAQRALRSAAGPVVRSEAPAPERRAMRPRRHHPSHRDGRLVVAHRRRRARRALRGTPPTRREVPRRRAAIRGLRRLAARVARVRGTLHVSSRTGQRRARLEHPCSTCRRTGRVRTSRCTVAGRCASRSTARSSRGSARSAKRTTRPSSWCSSRRSRRLHRRSGARDVRGRPEREPPEARDRARRRLLRQHTRPPRRDRRGDAVRRLARAREGRGAWRAGASGLPFERLVEALAPPRSPHVRRSSRSRSITSGLPRRPPSRSRAFAPTPLERDEWTSPFDLSLETEETSDRIRATFVYDVALFDRSTIERWAEEWTQLLDSATRAPSTPVGCLSMHRAHERSNT